MLQTPYVGLTVTDRIQLFYLFHRNPLRRPLGLDGRDSSAPDWITMQTIRGGGPTSDTYSVLRPRGARSLREDTVSSPSAFLVSDRETAFGRGRCFEKVLHCDGTAHREDGDVLKGVDCSYRKGEAEEEKEKEFVVKCYVT